jgi:hypothetical protein
MGEPQIQDDTIVSVRIQDVGGRDQLLEMCLGSGGARERKAEQDSAQPPL